MKKVAYLAPEGFVQELLNEIEYVEAVYDRLVLAQEQDKTPVWAQNIWFDPVFLPATSISVAVQQLKSLQLRWVNYAFQLHRRSELIQQQLPSIKLKPIEFLGELPTKVLGSWCLIDKNQILASAKSASPFANGEIHFHENKQDPPSRAYLKLWELFTVHGFKPNPNEICLDLGSSPGGWTWVLQKLGCQVISVDKAPLVPKVASLPRIRFLERSAFSLTPSEIGPIDWFFSDVVCYPQRLLRLVQTWLDSGLCKNFVCTIKLQGQTDMQIVQQFLQIPDSRLLHLYNNKHELTWICGGRP